MTKGGGVEHASTQPLQKLHPYLSGTNNLDLVWGVSRSRKERKATTFSAPQEKALLATSHRVVQLNQGAEEVVATGVKVHGLPGRGVKQLELVRLLHVLGHHLFPRTDEQTERRTGDSQLCTA